MACDMLVKLYNVSEDTALEAALEEDGVSIKRAIAGDLFRIVEFVRQTFGEGWAGEAQVAITKGTCYIAVRDKQVVGFACYECTRLNYFGPTGVLESERGKGIGKALLIRCMLSMREMGYGYAIIGWVGPEKFYEKAVGAVSIPDSFPGMYINMINVE